MEKAETKAILIPSEVAPFYGLYPEVGILAISPYDPDGVAVQEYTATGRGESRIILVTTSKSLHSP